MYGDAPPIEDFYAWRDWRVMDEIHWYTWFIDYWMEGGLMRDMFTHKITTEEHWNMLMMPTVYTRAELDYDRVVGRNTQVSPTYDPHCAAGDVTQGCQPVAVISAEVLRNYTEGPSETAKIANLLNTDERMQPFMIAQEAWDCIWAELIQRGKGLKTVLYRPGFVEADYNFSAEMLEEMILELNRVIAKYSKAPWNALETSNRLVELLGQHLLLIEEELEDLTSGGRRLTVSDFLGPKERRRRLQAENTTNSTASNDQQHSFEYFDELHRRRNKLRLLRVEKRKAERRAARQTERRMQQETKAERRAARQAERRQGTKDAKI